MRVVLILLILSLVGCSKKVEKVSPKYTVQEIMALAHETSPSKEKADALQLSDYAPGVNRQDSQALVYQRLVFCAVEFETEDEARKEAIRLNQYYSRNWLFDRVEGEPVLEDYVIETFKAINPNRQIQRVPKKHEEKHEEKSDEETPKAHGESEAHH